MSKQTSKEQTIIFTKKQFVALLKAVYLGNWVANAYRDKKHIKDYEDIENYVFSKAPLFGLEKYMDHEETDGDMYYPTSLFEEITDVHIRHDEYDEETLWDELAERLGELKFRKSYSPQELAKFSQKEWFFKLSDCVDSFYEEFEKYGLERLKIETKKEKK